MNNTDIGHMKRIGIQGYPGSFHEEAARFYWGNQPLTIFPADTFDQLGSMLVSGAVDAAIMAIENSIAGTILQNYRILRELNLNVAGELYLRIHHQLLGISGSDLSQITHVESHPMAIHQCLQFLSSYPHWKRLESVDTALSAINLIKTGNKNIACIASRLAAEKYGLELLATDIETHEHNYTRFFIVMNSELPIPPDADKASVYIRIPDEKGQLLQVLEWIHYYDLNMSQLQSFPVLGNPREYFFHLDVEFDSLDQYEKLKNRLSSLGFYFHQTGIYKRGFLSGIYE